MEFKSIIAKANGNGELEFHCRKEDEPFKISYHNDDWSYSRFWKDWKEWEQSAQVLKAFSSSEEKAILYFALINPKSSSDGSKGIDVTAWTNILLSSDDSPKGCSYYVFYKSPSKEEPFGESQGSQWAMAKEIVDILDELYKSPYGYSSRLLCRAILDKWKITRLPKA